MSASLCNYEVRVLRKGRWTTESRGMDKGQAMTTANGCSANRSYDGVKVVEEVYDESQGLFREKTIYSYFNQEDKVRAGEKAAEAMAAARAEREGGRFKVPPAIAGSSRFGTDLRGWMMIFAVFLGLGANVGLAVLIGDKFNIVSGPSETDWGTHRKTLVYDLPEITANFQTDGSERVIHIRVGLELEDSAQNVEVDRKLSEIVTRVAADLNRMDTGSEQLDIQELRERLQKGVQSAGETEIEGVLFKEVLIF